MPTLGEHNSDTNEGSIRSQYTSKAILEMKGDFATFHHMREIISIFERSAYEAGLRCAKDDMSRAIDQRLRES